jgi:hypothetical protein
VFRRGRRRAAAALALLSVSAVQMPRATSSASAAASKPCSARAPRASGLAGSRRLVAAVALFAALTGCGAADRVGEAADEVEQALQRVECVPDEENLCPVGERAWDLLQLAVDDCYQVVSIDSGPDASCCFAITVEISVDAAVDCL